MKDYAVQESRSRSNGVLKYLGIPLLIGSIGMIGATFPLTAPILSQTWSNFTREFREPTCEYKLIEAEGRDVNATVLVNRYKGNTPKEISNKTLVGILSYMNPNKDIPRVGTIPKGVYRVPTDCKYK